MQGQRDSAADRVLTNQDSVPPMVPHNTARTGARV